MGTNIRSVALLAFGVAASLAATGCTDASEDRGPVTWHEDVAPLVQKRCASCHTDGGIAPFALDDMATSQDLAQAMLNSVENGTMPPWLARDTDDCSVERPFLDDQRLSDEEVQTLRDWVAQGTLAGDAADAEVLPEPPVLGIPDPNYVASFEVPFTVDGDKDLFECFVLDPGNTEKVWVTSVQLDPGNPTVDHHGLMFVDLNGASTELIEEDGHFECFNPPSLPGYLIGAWTPGATPIVVPETSGMPLPAGAKIVVQMHYHPTGKGPETDQSQLELKWVTEEPTWEAAQALIGNFDDMSSNGAGLQPGPNDQGGEPIFHIPAMAKDHTEVGIYRQEIPLTFPVFSVGTHMHYVGTDMRVTIDRSNPGDQAANECLVQTPNWDFNWQRVYNYDVPIDQLPTVSPGDEITMACTYDNTLDNPFVAAALREKGLTAPEDVQLGEETLDEMCLGLFGILTPPGVLEESLFN